MTTADVAVIGAGASGTLQALHLLRLGTGRVTLIERARVPGRGVAYSTGRPEHLLNVPARRMTAFPADPDHFVRWFAGHSGSEEDFAPRMLYGDYLAGLLAEAATDDRLDVVQGEVVDIEPGERVRFADGRTLDVDAAILALGNFKPATPRGIDPDALGALWVDDPWATDIAAGLGPDDTILLVGTGLTAVDAALTLDATGFRGRVLALSRRGLAPRTHPWREKMVEPRADLPDSCVGLLRSVRARTVEVGWGGAVHELRTVTQGIWAGASIAERRRFLRHLRPWWDVHRHKVAPAIGARIVALQESGQLVIAAGKLVSAEADGAVATVRYRPRGVARVETVRAARIVNCTGPETDIARSGEPLLDALLAAGRIRPDPCRVGLDVDLDCCVIDAAGETSDSLYAIGPITRGAFWESVAVPDIRMQTQGVAERLLCC